MRNVGTLRDRKWSVSQFFFSHFSGVVQRPVHSCEKESFHSPATQVHPTVKSLLEPPLAAFEVIVLRMTVSVSHHALRSCHSISVRLSSQPYWVSPVLHIGPVTCLRYNTTLDTEHCTVNGVTLEWICWDVHFYDDCGIVNTPESSGPEKSASIEEVTLAYDQWFQAATANTLVRRRDVLYDHLWWAGRWVVGQAVSIEMT